VKSGNFESSSFAMLGSSLHKRGEMNTERRSEPSASRPLGRAVKIMVCFSMLVSLCGIVSKFFAVRLPMGRRYGFDELRIRSGKLSFNADPNLNAEKRDLNLDRYRGLTPELSSMIYTFF